ncbi:MAG: peptidase domain-containing protein [Chloroflexota bacterium]
MRTRAAIIAVFLVLAVAPVFEARAVEPGGNAFERTWSRTDQPVSSGTVSRTWMWGPGAFTGPMMETMVDAAGGSREVQYFDKSRMEITTSDDIDPDSIWYVTNGLLATELVTGRLQLGLDEFEDRSPADINAAGDENDPNAPTYATFTDLRDEPAFEQDAILTTRVSRDGTLSDDPDLAGFDARAVELVPETGHRVASPFWDFMNSSGAVNEGGSRADAALFPNPYYATGFPITEAYWTTVALNGEPTDVLIQVFERRVLTYTPGNEDGWRVEAGNVGRHYFNWRYGVSAPSEPPGAIDGAQLLGPTPAPGAEENGGRVTLAIANHAPSPLSVTVDGPQSRTIELPGCPDCQVTPEPPTSCSANAPTETFEVDQGNYRITSRRPDDNVTPLSGVWTFLPGSSYGACFFIIDND